MRDDQNATVIHDLVGIGFGPSNLALAIALAEDPKTRHLDIKFLEKNSEFSWHPGMMLPGSGMQIAFPKDLATFRNPRSEFTFINYLHERDRLVDFVNRQSFFPSREEFSDYLSWAAGRVKANVGYGVSAQRIEIDGDIFRISATSTHDENSEVFARGIVCGLGLQPRCPAGVEPGKRIFHNVKLLEKLREVAELPHGRIMVVGAGQSAAECLQYLHSQYPNSEIHGVFSRFGLSPSDDSPYANRIFDPGTVDRWHAAPPAVRDKLMQYHFATNYSAVDMDVITDLYESEYSERVRGQRRLFLHGAHELLRVQELTDGVEVAVSDQMSGEVVEYSVDMVVMATGFNAPDIRPLLGPTTDCYRFDSRGPVVLRDYRIESLNPTDPPIFLNGGVEHSHGLTSSLLSNIAIRSAEIAAAAAASVHQIPASRGVAEPKNDRVKETV